MVIESVVIATLSEYDLFIAEDGLRSLRLIGKHDRRNLAGRIRMQVPLIEIFESKANARSARSIGERWSNHGNAPCTGHRSGRIEDRLLVASIHRIPIGHSADVHLV